LTNSPTKVAVGFLQQHAATYTHTHHANRCIRARGPFFCVREDPDRFWAKFQLLDRATFPWVAALSVDGVYMHHCLWCVKNIYRTEPCVLREHAATRNHVLNAQYQHFYRMYTGGDYTFLLN
jgi:hypothetical protein